MIDYSPIFLYDFEMHFISFKNERWYFFAYGKGWITVAPEFLLASELSNMVTLIAFRWEKIFQHLALACHLLHLLELVWVMTPTLKRKCFISHHLLTTHWNELMMSTKVPLYYFFLATLTLKRINLLMPNSEILDCHILPNIHLFNHDIFDLHLEEGLQFTAVIPIFGF